jgi:integrase
MASPKLERVKNAPGIYKRGGRYVAIHRDPSGRQRKVFGRTLSEARRLKAEKVADVSRGEYRALTRITFAEYAPRWDASYKGRTSRGVGEGTLADYRRVLGLDQNLEPIGDGAVAFFGPTRLAEIGAADLRDYADVVASRGVKRNTVRLALAPVKLLLATAHEDGLIRSNPAAGLRNLLPADEQEEASEPVKALTPAELAAFLAEVPDRWRLFFEFLAEGGLRIGEAIELRWSDLDGSFVRVDRRFYRGKVGLPKGRKKRRVRLSESLARDLWNLRKDTRAAVDELVFKAERGGRIDQSNLMSRVLKPTARKVGIGEWPGFHTFRHSAATMLFRGGWNAAQVCRQLGHSDPGFTLRRYVHLLDTDLPEPSVLRDVGNNWATQEAEIDFAESSGVLSGIAV